MKVATSSSEPPQALAYVYFEDEPGRRSAAKLLTRDEARRMAANFAKLPDVRRPKTPRTLAAHITALDFLDRARRFRNAAISFPDMEGPAPHWPKNFYQPSECLTLTGIHKSAAT